MQKRIYLIKNKKRTIKDNSAFLNSGDPVPGAPIQLISQENEKFRINNQALDILKSLNGSIAICSVVGPYRTGKSYILNLLLNRPNGFVLGAKLVSCTRGIWMWDTPIKHKNEHGADAKTSGHNRCWTSWIGERQIRARIRLVSGDFRPQTRRWRTMDRWYCYLGPNAH